MKLIVGVYTAAITDSNEDSLFSSLIAGKCADRSAKIRRERQVAKTADWDPARGVSRSDCRA